MKVQSATTRNNNCSHLHSTPSQDDGSTNGNPAPEAQTPFRYPFQESFSDSSDDELNNPPSSTSVTNTFSANNNNGPGDWSSDASSNESTVLDDDDEDVGSGLLTQEEDVRLCDECGFTPCEWIKNHVTLQNYADILPEHFLPRQKRHLMYRHYVHLHYGYLGKGIRVRTPFCVERQIKMMFPEENANDFVGFMDADEAPSVGLTFD